MNNGFEVGGSSGGKYRDAKALPTGTPVRIASIEPRKSKWAAKKDGVETDEENWQLCVVFETLASGTTLTYEKGRAGARTTMPPAPFTAGDRFVHYYGGIYAKDGGGWRLAQQGGTFTFIKSIAEAGGPSPTDSGGKFEFYNGLEFTLDRVRGTGPQGTYWTPLAKEFPKKEAAAPADNAANTPPSTKKIGGKTKTPKATAAVPENAYTALSEEDRAAVDEYAAETAVEDINPEDLVGVVAKDIAHAKAILEGRYASKKAQEATA